MRHTAAASLSEYRCIRVLLKTAAVPHAIPPPSAEYAMYILISFSDLRYDRYSCKCDEVEA